MLATSSDSSDDVLTALASERGIKVTRGSLENVADRFLQASADMMDLDLLVRATADNPVPDGHLVESVLQDFARFGGDYIGPRSYTGDLPKGLLVEVCRLGALRRSIAEGVDAGVREHVTLGLAGGPAILNSLGCEAAGWLPRVNLSIDTLDDYLVAARAFGHAPCAARTPWRAIVGRFAALLSKSVA